MKLPKIRKLKSGKWFCQLRLGGKSYPVLGETELEVRDQANLVKANYRLNKGQFETPDITLRLAIDKYIESRDLKPSSLRSYRIIQRNRLQRVMDTDIKKIDFQAEMRKEREHLSEKTCKNTWGLISSVLRENGIQETVKIRRGPKTQREWLTPEEIPIFLDSVKGTRWELPSLLGLHSLRLSEILGLEWEDIDLGKNCFHVHQSASLGERLTIVDTNKTSRSTRTIEIFSARLRELLEEGGDGFVCSFCYNSFSRALKRICKNAGLPEVTAHGLRKSFASLCLHQGIPERVTAELGGWDDLSTMHNIYERVSEADRRKTAQSLSEIMDKKREG